MKGRYHSAQAQISLVISEWHAVLALDTDCTKYDEIAVIFSKPK